MKQDPSDKEEPSPPQAVNAGAFPSVRDTSRHCQRRLFSTVDEMIENGCMLVELTKYELRIINNALNEVCNGIDLEGEFDTRMGCTVEEAQVVLAKIHGLATSQ